MAESWADVQAGREIGVTQLAMLRLARTHAVQAAVQAIDLMYTAAGGSSVYTHNLLERCFRDAHTVTQHVSMNPANYQASGRVLLGLGPDRPLYRLVMRLRRTAVGGRRRSVWAKMPRSRHREIAADQPDLL